MWSVNGDQFEKLITKLRQIVLAIEVVQYLYTRSVPDPIEPADRRSVGLANQFLNKKDLLHKIFQLSGRVQEACFPRNH